MSRVVSTRLTNEDLAMMIEISRKHYGFLPSTLSELTRFCCKAFIQLADPTATNRHADAKAIEYLNQISKPRKTHRDSIEQIILRKDLLHEQSPPRAEMLQGDHLAEATTSGISKIIDISQQIAALDAETQAKAKNLWEHIRQGHENIEEIMLGEADSLKKELVAHIVGQLPEVMANQSTAVQKVIRQWNK